MLRLLQATWLAALTGALSLPTPAAAAPPIDEFHDAAELSPAHGEPPPEPTRPRDLWMYTYPRGHDPHYLRAALEVVSILVLGNLDYLANTRARGGTQRDDEETWDLRYDWPQFRRKLTLDGLRLDHNQFNTNYMAHPFAGMLYYTAARSNHLSWLESFAFTFTGSLVWEYFGELREVVSLNDAIVTPFAGFAVGEPLMQLSGFFARGRDTTANDVLAALFAPLRVVNDWADGTEPVASRHHTASGLPRDVWHRFELFAGAGSTAQRSLAGGAPATVHYFDTRVGLDLRLANLPGYGVAADRATGFGDANLSGLRFEATMSRGRLADALFATRMVPFGHYARSARRDARGRLHGSGTVVGWLASFEYGVHDYDRDGLRPLDVVALASPVGVTFEHEQAWGAGRLRAGFDLAGSFAGVTAYAMNAFRDGGDVERLQTSAREHGYYHALGLGASPSLAVEAGPMEVGARLRIDAFRGIEGFDELQDTIVREASAHDTRTSLRLWVAATGGPVRVEVAGQRRARAGALGEARASSAELSWMLTAGLVF